MFLPSDLPSSTAIVDVYSSFMNYVLTHTMKYLSQRGAKPWSSQVILILPHPSGWGEPQQNMLQEAAMNTDLLRKREVQIHFVEEAEAAARLAFASPDLITPHLKVRARTSRTPLKILINSAEQLERWEDYCM